MEKGKQVVGKSFDEMFGNATEFIPNPDEMVEGEFDSLDEEDAGGEDELADVDCTGIEPSDEEPATEDEDGREYYDFGEDEDDEDDDEDALFGGTE